MAKKQFKAESKRLLELMINSIYTHKEIFLRELISNASDAIDKLYYRSLTDDSVNIKKEDLEILLAADKITRTVTVSDNGIGMTKEELENNLGTICKSGSLAFKEENEKTQDVDIIGQFGVGFYSAFMVADKVTVLSKAYGATEAYKWESDGIDGYTVTPCEKEKNGTTIVLHIKPDTDEEKYEDFMESYEITRLVQRYSDYIRYPIKMAIEKSRRKEGSENEWEDYTTIETLNSMTPIWKKSKGEVTDEEYNAYYKEKFANREDPIKVIRTSTDGIVSYDALLFVPASAPYDFYTKDYRKGLQLYSSGVLIDDNCSELLPDFFGFVKGIVDSQNLSLNISREMLQHDRQLKTIANHLEKKIKSELELLLKNDREKYEKFFKNFGRTLKYGIYTTYGTKKELLQGLLIFPSSNGGTATLAEYTDRMKESQEFIYYASGQSEERLSKLPQCQSVKAKGFEVLYFTDEVDEFAISMMAEFGGKKFKNVADSDVATEEEKKQAEEKAQDNKDLFDAVKDVLGDKVVAVKPCVMGAEHPVCLRTEGEITFEMERMWSVSSPDGSKVQASVILEINTEHTLFEKLKAVQGDKETLGKYARVLLDQGRLIEGLPIDDPVEFTSLVCELMSK